MTRLSTSALSAMKIYTNDYNLTPPEQLKASLAEQLSVEQLRDEFRRYIKTKVAQELVDFYLDSLDREEVTGFFERQVTSSGTCSVPSGFCVFQRCRHCGDSVVGSGVVELAARTLVPEYARVPRSFVRKSLRWWAGRAQSYPSPPRARR